MSDREEDKPQTEPSESRERPQKPPAQQLTEEEINAPSKQTLVMLSVICASTLILWAAGRAACNYQVPGESLTPRVTTVEQRTRNAKNVGIELAQSVSYGDFKTALQISIGDAASWVKKEQAECGSCVERKATREKILSVGTVLKANSIDSIVKVRTVGAPGGEVVRFFGIEREGRKWRASRIYKDAESAELKAAPVRNTAPLSIRRQGDSETEADTAAKTESEKEAKPKSASEGAEKVQPEARAPSTASAPSKALAKPQKAGAAPKTTP